ncbi:MAG: adenylate/guanylate cyclase domain-containing protein, partial [Chloroflexota bacterium]
MSAKLIQVCQTYIPAEQQAALAEGCDLPEQASGAALFADISGFTPLTEALTRALGLRRGAEELPLYLDRVYDDLIAAVHRQGGSVIGFAGDSITCWFDDEPIGLRGAAPGVQRAITCAQAMQVAMGAFAHVPVPGQTPATLSLKVAVAAGQVRRLLVGSPEIQRIELVAGDTLTRMAAAEHQASQGEILLDESAVRLLGEAISVSQWRQDGPARYAVLAGLNEPAEPCPWPPVKELVLEQVRPWVLATIYKRLESGLGDFLTELRPVTALFLRFGGIDYEHDPEAGHKLDGYIRWVQEVLTSYEAVLTHPTIGDKGSFLCMSFGAPLAHEDDTQRAAEAAQTLSRPPESLSFITPAQIGLSLGMARTGSYGGGLRRTYDILGDQVNLAARLMVNTRPGQILVSARAAETLEQEFELERLEPIQVKGKSHPVDIARLVGIRQGGRSAAGGAEAAPLFGRTAELLAFDAALRALRQRDGSILHLYAPSGLGKTRLAGELSTRAAAHGVWVLSGAGQSTRTNEPYLAWQPIFRELLGYSPRGTDALAFLQAALQDRNPEWVHQAPLSGALLGVSLPDTPLTAALDAEQRSQATRALAVRLLEGAAVQQPVLILLDDVHWLDEPSQVLTRDVARVAAAAGLCLVLLQRDEDGLLSGLDDLEGYTPLPLPPLEQEHIQSIIEHILGAAPNRLATEVVQALSEGSPQFAIQLLKMMQESGVLRSEAGRWDFSESVIHALRDANAIEKDLDSGEWRRMPGATIPAAATGLPDSVQGALLARLDRLPETHKLTLRTASVIGRSFSLPVLERAHPAFPGAEALVEQLQCFAERDFVQ